MLCEILTDNRNRTAGEVRKIFELAEGKLGETGCVAWMFDRKGLFAIPAAKVEEDALMELALEAARTTCGAWTRILKSPAIRAPSRQ